MKGRKDPITKLEQEFWKRFPGLLADDPEDKLNDIIGFLRFISHNYFKYMEKHPFCHKSSLPN